jgi:Ribonuclease G/E
MVEANIAVNTGEYHVHFRSNAKNARIEDVSRELETLYAEIQKLREQEISDLRVVRRGEYLALITIPRPAKDILDSLRSEVTPTIMYHHTLKSFGDTESKMVDCAENAAKVYGKPQPETGTIIMGYLIDKHPKKTVIIDHYRPEGGQLRLGPFKVEDLEFDSSNVRVKLYRIFRTAGMLDGLNVEKKPGDYSYTFLSTCEWYIIHEYYRKDGSLLGVYGNINTPPEIGLGRIKYLDLHIDVVKKPGMPAEVIDSDKLEKVYSDGLISEPLYKKAISTAEQVKKLLEERYT